MNSYPFYSEVSFDVRENMFSFSENVKYFLFKYIPQISRVFLN